MDTIISRSPEETAELGRAWGREVRSGLLIGLAGDLGSGKTQLVRGLAEGLNCLGRVSSPTFTLVHEYEQGRLPLAHLDLYRLESREQIVQAGLEDYLFQPDGIVVVEWIDRWWNAGNGAESIWQAASASGLAPFRMVQLVIRSEQEREITYEDIGT